MSLALYLFAQERRRALDAEADARERERELELRDELELTGGEFDGTLDYEEAMRRRGGRDA